MPTGPCPEFVQGDVTFQPAGGMRKVAMTLSDASRTISGGPLIFYWYATTSSPIEARRGLPIADVTAAVEYALKEVCGGGRVGCRFTHVYPDGAAPYFTVLAPARRGSEVQQWDEVKAAAGEAVLAGGGTITHHHAVGRDHRPWYDRQRPDPFAAALRAAKQAVDPAGVLNPGVLLP